MGQPPSLFAELGRWRDKAVKRGKVTPFSSDIIPEWLNVELLAAQEAVGPEAAFSFLKQVPLSVRMAAERRIKRKLSTILGKYKRRAALAVRRGEQFDYTGLADELRVAVLPEMRNLTVDNTMRLSAEVGIAFDPSIVNTDALRWAREYTFDLINGLNDTTRRQLNEAISAFVQTPGLTIGDVESLIEPTFGAARAEMIAATETTRAYSMATNRLRDLLDAEDVPTVRVWNTMNDELVCPICGPLEGAPETSGKWPTLDGPPAHPNCRCSTSIRFEDIEDLDTEFAERQAVREQILREMENA